MTKKIDKRTKAYKESQKAKGLGDSIEKITKATGIDKLVKFVAGEDCGCQERKEKLNKLFPYKKVNCLTESEYKYLDTFFKASAKSVNGDTQKKLVEISNRVFNERKTTSTCNSCVISMVNRLNKLYKEYDK